MNKHNDMFGTEIHVDDVIVFAHNPHKLVNLYKGKVTNITTRFIMAEYTDEWATEGRCNIFGHTVHVSEMQ
mgnify:CR=1 FL=1